MIGRTLAGLVDAWVQPEVANQLPRVSEAPDVAAGQGHEATDHRVGHRFSGDLDLEHLQGAFDQVDLGQVPLHGGVLVFRQRLLRQPSAAADPDKVPMRARRDPVGKQDRLDQVLESNSLAYQLRAPGDLPAQGEGSRIGHPHLR